MLRATLAFAFFGAAIGSSLLALANGPVGPATYTPALTELRGRLGHGSTLVLAPTSGCWPTSTAATTSSGSSGAAGSASHSQGPPTRTAPPDGVAHVITQGSTTPPFADLRLARRAGPYFVWETRPAPAGRGPCPLISVGARADLDTG